MRVDQLEPWLQAHAAIAGWIIAAGLVLRYLPGAVLGLIAACTRDDARIRAWLESVRLSRRDAAHLTSYLPPPAPAQLADAAAVEREPGGERPLTESGDTDGGRGQPAD